MRAVAAALMVLPLAACATYSPRLPMQYSMPLTAVERPAIVSERWGAYELVPGDSTGYVYQDNLVAVAVLPAGGVFHIEMTNRSDQTIQLVWDQAAYIDSDGFSSKVSEGDVRVIDMGSSQPPRVIPRGSRVALTIIPHSNFITGAYGNTIEDFVPLEDGVAESFGAKAVKLMIPLSVQGVVNEYTFLFRIENVRYPWTEPGCNLVRYRGYSCSQ